MKPTILVLALALLLLPTLPAGAQERSIISEAAEALRQESVYVHPGAAEQLTPAEQEEIRQAIRDAGNIGSIYIAVLPEEALDESGLSPERALYNLGDALDRPGTYVAVIGRNLQVNSTDGTPFGEGGAEPIGDAAAAANQGAPIATVLLDVVDRLRVAADAGTVPGEPAADPGGGSPVLTGLLVAGLAGGGLLLLRRSRRRREEERAHVAEVRTAVVEDLAALDAKIRDLDNDLRLVDESMEVKRDHLQALESYGAASEAVDRARRVQDFQAATAAIEEGQYAVASARARLEGREPPERTVPCFFDPRHGPSVTEMEWMPSGGQPRPVPVCAADAARLEDGEIPIGRQVVVGGDRRPYWDAPRYWGPWAGGYYGANSGFLSGLLLGSWFGGWGWGGGGWYGSGGHSPGEGFGGFGGFGDGGGGFGGFGDGGGGFGGGDF